MKSVFTTVKSRGGSCSFSELFPLDDKPTLVVTFLSLLELMKRQMVMVEQRQNFDDLTVNLINDRWEEESFEPIDE
jgi:segregation and condensation protein A